jgi:hypothetical protein
LAATSAEDDQRPQAAAAASRMRQNVVSVAASARAFARGKIFIVENLVGLCAAGSVQAPRALDCAL